MPESSQKNSFQSSRRLCIIHFAPHPRSPTMKNKPDLKNQDNSRKMDKYWVPIIARTIDLLDCFGAAGRSLTLEDVVKVTAIPHTTAYRILHTLVMRDYLSRSGRQYRLNQMRRRLKFGFANLSRQVSLAVEIEQSLRNATAGAGIDLMVWDNDRSADLAIQNAREMAACKVDLAIEFQLYENVAPVISDIFLRSEIPLISLVNPHHGTVYFGVNNYRAGFAAGAALAEHALRQWNSEVDALVLLESPRAGRTIQSRLIGAVQGVQEKLGPLPEKNIHHLRRRGRESRFARRRRRLPRRQNRQASAGRRHQRRKRHRRVEAARQARYGVELAIAGHGGSAEIVDVASDPDSPCIGTVCFQPERYGPDLIDFAPAHPARQIRPRPPLRPARVQGQRSPQPKSPQSRLRKLEPVSEVRDIHRRCHPEQPNSRRRVTSGMNKVGAPKMHRAPSIRRSLANGWDTAALNRAPFIRSERGPKRLSPGSPRTGLSVRGVEVGGGEPKDLLLAVPN